MKKDKNEAIAGIVCSVSHCDFNDGSGHCVAKQVEIGPMNAVSCTDTVCATFKPKSEQAEGRIFP